MTEMMQLNMCLLSFDAANVLSISLRTVLAFTKCSLSMSCNYSSCKDCVRSVCA